MALADWDWAAAIWEEGAKGAARLLASPEPSNVIALRDRIPQPLVKSCRKSIEARLDVLTQLPVSDLTRAELRLVRRRCAACRGCKLAPH